MKVYQFQNQTRSTLQKLRYISALFLEISTIPLLVRHWKDTDKILSFWQIVVSWQAFLQGIFDLEWAASQTVWHSTRAQGEEFARLFLDCGGRQARWRTCRFKHCFRTLSLMNIQTGMQKKKLVLSSTVRRILWSLMLRFLGLGDLSNCTIILQGALSWW